MSDPANVVWRHLTVAGNEHGVAIVQSGLDPGTRAVWGGGFAGGPSTSESEIGAADAQGGAPMIGSYLEYDPATDSTYFIALFACPYGSSVRTHVWALAG